MSPNLPAYTVRDDGSRVTIRFVVKELTDAFLEECGDDLTRLADECGTRHLHLDLGEVDYLSSTALGKIVGMHKRVARSGGKFSVGNVNDFPYEVLCVTRLNTILDVRRKRAAKDSVPA